MSRRSLLRLNSTVRLAYGLAGLIAPRALATARFAADTEDRPDARLFVRAFSAHQALVGGLGLAALRRPGLEAPAIAAAIATDASDIVSALAEAARRRRLDQDLGGGIVFSGAGLATGALAAAVE